MANRFKRIAVGLTFFVLALVCLTAVSFAAEPTQSNAQRIYGQDRYETAFKTADRLKEALGLEQFEAVVVASGRNFPDALTGSYLAVQNRAPILMTAGSDINALKSYLEKNLKPGGTVYILGGTNAVPASLDVALSQYRVIRLQGSTRYETNLQILSQVSQPVKTLLVCDGGSFADSLSASATNLPILLVNGKTNRLSDSQKAYLRSLGEVKLCIIGGEKAVSKALETELKAFGQISRIGGATRVETSALLAQAFFPEPQAAVLAYSLNFPDGLCGGPLAYTLGGPVLLTKAGAEAPAKAYAQEKNIQTGIVLGGKGLVSDTSVRRIFSLSASDRIRIWPKYKIEYVLNGGENSPENPSQYEQEVEVYLKNATKAYCSFGGWFLDPDFKTRIKTVSADMTGDLTLYAKWVPKSYPVNYYLDGGENNPENPSEYTYGQPVSLYAPTKTNCQFVGWYLDTAFTTKAEDGFTPETGGNLKLYARWESRTYGIRYVLNGGENSPENPASYTYGQAVLLKAPTKANHQFMGWYLEADFLTKVDSVAKNTTGELTLYARWEVCCYAITYVLNGGENNLINPDAYGYGDSIQLLEPFRENYQFQGWYLEDTFVTKVDSITPTMTGELTLYALWEGDRYTIRYVLNGGENSPENPSAYNYGQSIQLKAPTKDSYTFEGWYRDRGLTQKVASIGPNETGHLTLYANWYLEPLAISGTGMDNMIWSWWYYPQVVSSNEAVYWGYTTNDGYCGVARYDFATDAVTKTILKKASRIDDHNGLALTTLKDGRIVCVYAGGHNSDNDIHIRISGKSGSIESFDTHVVLRSSGKTCYGQILEYQGNYHIFYRINNHSWGHRASADCLTWSEETVLVTSGTQYYCRFMPTTQPGLVRVCMCSNPTATDPRIRMGFLNLDTGELLNADAQTVLGKEKVSYDLFDVLLTPPEGKIQRLFDVAITEPQQVRILYTVFSKAAGSDDSVYYLYDSGTSHEICQGGKPLWDPKYQLGAAFVDKNTIVAGRNEAGTDHIEIYTFADNRIRLQKLVDTQSGTANSRNARPIVDINGRAFLWHNGYYNPKVYTDFDTDARMYLIGTDTVVSKAESYIDEAAFSKVNNENTQKVMTYVQKLYQENTFQDYVHADFTWDPATRTSNWIHFTGLMFEAFLETDFDTYYPVVKSFYDQHINSDGSIKNYLAGELDAALLGVGMIRLINSNVLSQQEKALYTTAVNYIFNQLENQTIYPQAGNLWLHSQKADGTPRAAWEKWNICLDGVYMSQLFLIRLAESMDAGTIEITGKDGIPCSAQQLWNDIYSRLSFVMENMRNPQNGLLYHGYCVETEKTNEASWSRGIGWYTMVLMEAAEKFPDTDKRAVLKNYFNQQMAAICRWQDPATFLWYNVTDGKESYAYTTQTPSGEEIIPNKPETSGSAMFAYCLLRGYQNGLLDSEVYYRAGMLAFNALAQNKLTEEGLIDIYSSSSVTSNKNLYQKNGYVINDGKGIGPFILAAKYAY